MYTGTDWNAELRTQNSKLKTCNCARALAHLCYNSSTCVLLGVRHPSTICSSEGMRIMSESAEQVREMVDAVYRADSRRVLATLIRLLGDFDLAEEALHDAFSVALERWPRDG